ncbi:hypothetical protein BDR05DRAFT_1005946 [Suillus weaverae]|nr:hypothetical protein BDR05DRAFT_1005946 [Suillus weaverae]
MKEADKELDPADYQGIKFWTRSKWSHHLQAIKNVTKIDHNSSEACTSMRGSSRLAKGKNVACQFIEDADGEPVDGHRAKTMRNVFSSYLHQLNQGDVKLPPTWSQVALDIKEGFYHAIHSNHVEFRYCADNWKAEYLATHNYSQWYKYHILLIHGQKQDRSVAMDNDKCVKPSSSRTKKLKAERTPSPLSEDMELDYVDLEPSHGVEDDTLVLPEKLKNPLNAPPTGLRWMKSRMESLLEEQDEGIQDKMAEVKMYTDMLEKLKRANGV